MTDIHYVEDDRMTGVELLSVREYLGLTREELAALLHVSPSTERFWEIARTPIPFGVREEVEQIEQSTAQAVTALVEALKDAPEAAIAVYRTTAEMHAARPDTRHLPARWWRHVAMRAAHEIPGVEIIQA